MKAKPGDPPADLQREVDRALAAGGLDQLGTRELLGVLLSCLFHAERGNHLEQSVGDKGNGAYDRGVNVGSLPIEVEVPRTRSGDFRPSQLPPPYQRGYGDAAGALLRQLVAASRSMGAARQALRGLDLPISDEALNSVARHFIEEFELRNTRPLDTDLLALFIDGKYVEVREGDRLRPSCVYLTVGLGRDGKKRVLACQVLPGRESLEHWKSVLRSLIERGLRNVLMLVQDDFSGLLSVTKSLFPTADVQLCIVHLQRNAKTHLGKAGAAEFNSRLRTIKVCYDPELAAGQWEQLCQACEKDSPTFIAELRKKHEHYLAFLRYPEQVRRSFSTTNAVEAVNGQLEIMRRNNGGYFSSADNLKARLGITINRLENGRWSRLAASISSALAQLNAMFVARFEGPS
jgi:transposase-like protein